MGNCKRARILQRLEVAVNFKIGGGDFQQRNAIDADANQELGAGETDAQYSCNIVNSVSAYFKRIAKVRAIAVTSCKASFL